MASERLVRFTIPGPPRTKKNHGRVVKRGGRKFHVASDAYTAWNQMAQQSLAVIRAQALHQMFPFNRPVNCRALFYRDADRGDAVGYYQGLADALQEGKILENDVLIVSWDGSRLLKDADNPRVEVVLEVASA